MAGVKECLRRLTEKNVDMQINKHLKYLIENVEEEQLIYKLSQQNGITIDNEKIKLWYHPGIGFQCKNMYQERFGRLPLCGFIERYLNEQLHTIQVE